MLTILTSCLQEEKSISISTKPNSEAGAGGGASGNDPGDNDAAPSVVIPTYNNNLAWVTQLGAVTSTPGNDTSKSDECKAVATDSSGNVYCAGSTFTGSLGEASGGNNDAFVMKLNNSGAIQWITQLGDTTSVPGGDTTAADYCEDVTVDNEGNVYCAGYTSGALGESNGGGTDAFIMKLNSSGVVQWITQLGATTNISGGNNGGNDYCRGVAVDSSGNVYCTGDTDGNLGEASGGSIDVFVMKLDSSGSLLWLTHFGSITKASGFSNSANDTCYGVAVDNDGGVYCAGKTHGSMFQANSTTSNNDAIFIKLNSSTGNLVWGSQLGSSHCGAIAVDSVKNVYCTGYTWNSFGESAAGNTDGYVIKLNSTGSLEWVTQFGSITTPSAVGADELYTIAVDKDGNIYTAGATKSSLGGEGFAGGYDAYLIKMDPSGTLTWIKQLGDSTKASGGDNAGFDYCYGVSVDTNGNVYCAGRTNGGMGETNGGGYDAFVMKLE